MKDEKYYGKSCLSMNFSRCSGFSLLNRSIHGSDEHQFGNMRVEMQSFKYITYQSDTVKESKKIALVKSRVQMIIACFLLTCSVSTYTLFKGHILIQPLFSWQQVRVCDFFMEFYKKTE